MLKLDLPLPPSTNAIWRSLGKRVVRSRRYREWLDEADALTLFTRAKHSRIDGAFEVEIVLDASRRAGDLDNRLKPILDYLQRLGIVQDDALCQRLTASWGTAEHGCRVRVWAVDERDLALEFSPEESAMADRALERWAQQLGISLDELEQRLAA